MRGLTLFFVTVAFVASGQAFAAEWMVNVDTKQCVEAPYSYDEFIQLLKKNNDNHNIIHPKDKKYRVVHVKSGANKGFGAKYYFATSKKDCEQALTTENFDWATIEGPAATPTQQ